MAFEKSGRFCRETAYCGGSLFLVWSRASGTEVSQGDKQDPDSNPSGRAARGEASQALWEPLWRPFHWPTVIIRGLSTLQLLKNLVF